MKAAIPIDLEGCRKIIASTVRQCANTLQDQKVPVWSIVSVTLCIGSSAARVLCEAVNIDPDVYAPVSAIDNEVEGYCRLCGNEIQEEGD